MNCFFFMTLPLKFLEHRPILKNKFPNDDDRSIVSKLEEYWDVLEAKDKSVYNRLASDMKEHHAAIDKSPQIHRRPKNIIENSNNLSAGTFITSIKSFINIITGMTAFYLNLQKNSRSPSCCFSNCAMLAEAAWSSFFVAAVTHFNSTVTTSQTSTTTTG